MHKQFFSLRYCYETYSWRSGRCFILAGHPPPPPPAQADSVQMQCPASVKEGGLVAHAAFDCAPNGWEYCEYRDNPGYDNWSETAPASGRERPRAYITINATTGGQWGIVTVGQPLIISTLGGATGLLRYTVKAGETKKIEVKVWGRGNYRKDGNTTADILVIPPGGSDHSDAIASCTVTVQDDDNTAYVGSRHYHPYGATWQSEPYCYDEVGCASRQ